MEIKTIQQPMYQLILSAEEMGWLWDVMRKAHHINEIDHSAYFFNRLEDIRPAGGFGESR